MLGRFRRRTCQLGVNGSDHFIASAVKVSPQGDYLFYRFNHPVSCAISILRHILLSDNTDAVSKTR